MKNLIFREPEKPSKACLARRCLFSAICLTTLMYTCFAQDIILTTESKKIEAKVTEVNADDIRYKNFDNLNGPVYTLSKYDISAIFYENGIVETFFEWKRPKPPTPTLTVQDSVKKDTTPTFQSTTPIINTNKPPQPEKISDEMRTRNPEMYSQYTSGKKMKTTGWVLTGTGVGAVVCGIAVLGAGMKYDDAQLIKGGTTLSVAGAVITGAGVPTLIIGGNKKKKALNNFNSQSKTSNTSSPHFQFNLYPNKAELAFIF